MATQKTIGKEGIISGIGLHSGKPGTVRLKPAAPDSGIRFLKEGQAVGFDTASPSSSNGVSAESPPRCAYIGNGPSRILTVEHLLAALNGLGITNAVVEVEGPEIPGLDGSALPFVKFLKGLGIVSQPGRDNFYRIREPIFCGEKNKAICIYPSDRFSVSYTLDYENPYLKNQKVDFVIDAENFESQIAPARTFCTEAEAERLRTEGYGLGASRENTLVISQDGAHLGQLRFEDECARHKVLDIVGDLALLGFPVLGHVVGLRSGHFLNRQLVDAIKKQREVSMDAKKKKEDAGSPQMGSEEIKKILPHRYPFLLVDQVLEIGEKNAVCIKNVSANEPFFQGHFPQKAVMPGVLMLEALAQAGGILILSKPEYRGKMAYLVSIDHARFRKIVLPGDQLRLEIELLKFKARVGLIRGMATVAGNEVCSADIMFSLVD